jgi:tetratricopeptide (TPR) repeat protein
MNSSRWRRIEEVFAGALELPSGLVPGYLEESCAGDIALRREVEALLVHDRPGGEPLAAAVAGAASLLDAWEPGQSVGGFCIQDLIGHGGMASVYLATRSGVTFGTPVAIKVMNRWMGLGQPAARFRHERQILARLDHPLIARLLGGGASVDGLQYLVMEYVDGRPVTNYCRDSGLGIPARLELFRTICSAVQYAHQNLVVHRDIKPSNILVTASGVPKLLDFGIAKLLDQSSRKTSTIRLMTPAYASPEQILGAPIGTATDVYSLGVLLFELLTGKLPFDWNRESAPGEIERLVCHSHPPKPSDVVPPRLAAVLRGDLDNIVLKAMQKDPLRRYSSPELLAEDLRRSQVGLPVLARPDTAVYRAGKFVQRRIVPLAGLTAVAASLCLSIVAATRQTARADRRLAQMQQLATAFLFDIHDKVQPLQGSLAARVLMVDRTLEYLDTLAFKEATQAGLAWDTANSYERAADIQGNPHYPGLGRIHPAIASYRKAILMKEQLVRAHAQEERITSLAGAYGKLGDMLSLNGDLPGQVEAYRARLELLNRISGPAAALPRAQARLALGQALFCSGRLREAEQQYRAAAAICEEIDRTDVPDTEVRHVHSEVLMAWGDVAGNPGTLNLLRREESEALHRRAKAINATLGEPLPADPRDDLRRQLAVARTLSPPGRRRSALQEILNQARQSMALSPHNMIRLGNLADSYEALAEDAAREKDWALAGEAYKSSLELWRQWQRRLGHGPYVTARFRQVSDKLAALGTVRGN